MLLSGFVDMVGVLGSSLVLLFCPWFFSLVLCLLGVLGSSLGVLGSSVSLVLGCPWFLVLRFLVLRLALCAFNPVSLSC